MLAINANIKNAYETSDTGKDFNLNFLSVAKL